MARRPPARQLACAVLAQAAVADAEVADFVSRAKNFWNAWLQEYQKAGKDLYKRGCGW